MVSAADLFNAVATAETGGETNPFIRTRVTPKGGSTAYGPVQITATLAKDFLNRLDELFNKDEKSYLRRFIKQGEKFTRFGNEPNKKGFEERFDYGGEGELTSSEDQSLYKEVAQKMLGFIHTKNNGNLENTLKEWRFGSASKKGKANDPEYFKRVEESIAKPVQEGDVLTAPLVDIEGEVRESIQRQLSEQNASPVASEELSGVLPEGSKGLTEEEQAELEFLRDDLAARATAQEGEEFKQEGLTEEEAAELAYLEEDLKPLPVGPSFIEPEEETDLIQEIF